jgi:PhnB protein
MTSINPYLTFSGSCEEAFDFYRSIFGGEFDSVNRYSEMPPDSPPQPGDENLILHMSLPMGHGQYLMGSDRPGSMGPATLGDNVAVTVSLDSVERAQAIFEGLSQGGQVTMPFERAFWGSDFGMCVDRFGINWMVDHAPSSED